MTKEVVADEEVKKNIDALKEQELDDDPGVEEEDKETQVSQAEATAREKGWVPKEEWEGDPEEWVPAKEFLARKPLFDSLHKQNKTIKQLKRTIDSMKDHFSHVREDAYKQAKADLERAKREAAADGNIEEYDKINDELQKLEPPKVEVIDTEELYENWKEENSWFESNPKLRRYADGLASEIKRLNPEIKIETLMDQVANQVKEDFPEVFNKQKPSTKVDPGTRRVVTDPANDNPKVMKYSDLDHDQKLVYHQLVKSKNNPGGVFTHEEYMKQLTDKISSNRNTRR